MDGNVLRQALANNADPPPPHLYAEMARWTYMDGKTQEKFYGAVFAALHGETSFSLRTLADTFTSSGSSSTATSSAAKDKVHVLYKVLHLIKVLCETGSADFQKAAQRHEHTERMRLLCHFHAAPDPLYGDAFNAKVRREAEAALQATLAPRADTQPPFAVSSSTTSSNNAGSYLQQRTTGFGSGVVAQPRQEQEGGANSEHGGGGEADMTSAVQWRSRVAEMPTRNAWAEHMAAASQRGGAGAGDGGTGAGRSHTTTQSSKTGNLFEHLAQSAKDAMRLLREHEALRTQAGGEASLTQAQRRQRAQQLAAAGAAVGSSRGGGFVPLDTRVITLPTSNRTNSTAQGDEARPAQTTAFAFLRADTGNAAPSSSSSSSQQQQHGASASPKNDSVGSQTAQSHASSSAFAFLTSLSPPAMQQPEGQRENVAGQRAHEESSTCVPCPFQGLLDKYTRRSASATALSRGELASFVQECVDAVHGVGAKGNKSNNNTRALCEALQERLALQRPWQERLHTLCCLAALLQHMPPALDIDNDDDDATVSMCNDHNDDRQLTAKSQTAEVLYDAFADTAQRTTEKCNNSPNSGAQAVALGVFRYFRQHAEAVRRNTAVVQASLRERACCVLHSLRLETGQERKEDAVPVPVTSSTAEAASGLSWAGMKVRQGGTQLRRKPIDHTTQQQPQTMHAHTLQGFFDPTTTTTMPTTASISSPLPYPSSLHTTKQPITEEELFGTTTQVMAPPPQEAMQWPPASTQDTMEGVQGMQAGDGYEAMPAYDIHSPPATATAPLLHIQSGQTTSNSTQQRGRRVFAEVQAEMRARMADASDT